MYLPLIKTITLIYLGLFTAGFSSVVFADSQGNYQSKMDTIGKQIKKISDNLNKNKKILKTEQHKLLEIEKRIKKIADKLRKTKQRIAKKQDNIKRLEQQVIELDEQYAENKKLLSGLILDQYKKGNNSQIKMLLNKENPYELGRLNNYYSFYTKAYQKKIGQINKQIKEYKALKIELADQSIGLEQQLALHKQEQKELDAAFRKRENVVLKLNGKVSKSGAKLKQLKADRKRLNKLITQIAKQQADIRRIEKQRAKQNDKLTLTKTVKRTPVKGGFRGQKGRLSLPVKGKIKQAYGSRIASSGMKAEGMLIETGNKQAVRSIFRGRVLFSDWLKGYGLLLIIDHGDNHISLYGHNELVYKNVGDTVETNEVVSQSGVTGGLKTPSLYFEVRNRATPVNPTLWCQ